MFKTRDSLFVKLYQQGVDAWFGSHPPTKTLPLHGDMTKGRLCHVPAFSIFRYGTGLSQEPYEDLFDSTRLSQSGIFILFYLRRGTGLSREP